MRESNLYKVELIVLFLISLSFYVFYLFYYNLFGLIGYYSIAWSFLIWYVDKIEKENKKMIKSNEKAGLIEGIQVLTIFSLIFLPLFRFKYLIELWISWSNFLLMSVYLFIPALMLAEIQAKNKNKKKRIRVLKKAMIGVALIITILNYFKLIG